MKKSILINPEQVQQYIKDIRKIPIISHERQEELFELLKSNDLTKADRKKYKDELVVGNLRFVISVAKMYQGQGLDIMDLISEGNVGLLKAVEKFDPTNGVKFISYAVWWIRQSIISSLNENARTIRLPVNIVNESQKFKKTERFHENDLVVNDENEQLLTTLPFTIGLYDEINDDGDQLIDTIVNQNADNPEDACNSMEEIKKKVNIMLSILDEREKIIIERYYGLTGVESNLEDLGEEFGCTKERIRQLKDRSIRKLRDNAYDLLKYL